MASDAGSTDRRLSKRYFTPTLDELPGISKLIEFLNAISDTLDRTSIYLRHVEVKLARRKNNTIRDNMTAYLAITNSIIVTCQPLKLNRHTTTLSEIEAHRSTYIKYLKALSDIRQTTQSQEWGDSEFGTSLELEMGRVISPIATLPNELLLRIFDYYLASSMSDVLPGDCFSEVNFSPWLLSHVCRKWRAVIFSYPAAWSDVQVETDGGKGMKNLIFHLISYQITLSGDQPLQLDLRMDHLHHPELFDIFFPHYKRWQTLYVHWDSEDTQSCRVAHGIMRRMFEPVDQIQFTQLSTLHLQKLPFQFELNGNASFPNLDSASLHSLLPEPMFNHFPWSNLGGFQLTSHLDGDSADTFLKTLRSLTNLRVLVLGPKFDEMWHPRNPSTAVLPLLQRLTLRAGYGSFVDFLVAPSLQTLDIRIPPVLGFTTADVRAVVNMISRSFCSITTFLAPISFIWVADIENMLSVLPALRTMDLDMCYPPKDLYTTLACILIDRDRDGKPKYCPVLKTIRLNDCGKCFCDERRWELLIKLVEFRYHQVDPANRLSCVVLDDLNSVEGEKWKHDTDPYGHLKAFGDGIRLDIDMEARTEGE